MLQIIAKEVWNLMTFSSLYACSFKSKDNFDSNYKKLKSLLVQNEADSLTLFPEVCLTDFCYENIQGASDFFISIKEDLIKLSHNKAFGLTVIEKENSNFYNNFYLFENNKIIHKRAKYKLFKLGKEDNYFKNRDKSGIELFQIKGLNIGVLICFELRFVEYWQRLKGADIILIPAMWGKKRKSHFESLIKSLAIINQCYVIASDSKNINMSNSSAIVTPFGKLIKNDNKNSLTKKFDKKELIKIRRYIDILK
jgi:predicted amidohydrolase